MPIIISSIIGFLLVSLLFYLSFRKATLRPRWYYLRYQLFRLFSVTFPSIMNQMEEGIIILDNEFSITNVNKTGKVMVGKAAVHIIGQKVDSFFPNVTATVSQSQQEKQVFSFVLDEQIYELQFSHLFSWTGNHRGYTIVSRDITEQQQIKAMKREMLQTMVHDLRAPISNSLFALQMLEQELSDEVNDTSKQLVEMTIDNTEKVLDRVNKILDVERLDTNNLPIQATAVSLPQIIESVIQSQKARLLAKELIIHQAIPKTVPLAMTDPQLIERILQNLIDNSIKFTPNGGEITINITAVHHQSAVDSTLLISVSDTGTGIPEELHERIFEKFTTESGKGSNGIGLSFCKMALDAQKQRIWVTSEPGKGSTFTFSLPILKQSHNYSQP